MKSNLLTSLASSSLSIAQLQNQPRTAITFHISYDTNPLFVDYVVRDVIEKYGIRDEDLNFCSYLKKERLYF